MNAWEILGIAETTDRKAIRRAYAQKSKTCHPEETPEAFQQLHDAYQQALEYCASGVQPQPQAPVETPRKMPVKSKPAKTGSRIAHERSKPDKDEAEHGEAGQETPDSYTDLLLREQRQRQQGLRKKREALLKAINKLLDNRLRRDQPEAWQEIMNMVEWRDVLLDEKFAEAFNRLLPPNYQYFYHICERLEALYRKALNNEPPSELVHMLLSHLRYLISQKAEHTEAGQRTLVIKCGKEYYRILNSPDTWEPQAWDAFFSSDDFQAVRENQQMITRLTDYVLSQEGAGAALLSSLYRSYNFKEYDPFQQESRQEAYRLLFRILNEQSLKRYGKSPSELEEECQIEQRSQTRLIFSFPESK